LLHMLNPATLGDILTYWSFVNKVLGLLLLSALTFSLSGCAQEIETVETEETEEKEETEETWQGSGAMSVNVLLMFDERDVQLPGDPCDGSTDYPDLGSGTSVTLRDSAGVIVGLSRLEGGTLVSGYVPKPEFTLMTTDDCAFKFQFVDVESDDKFFSVEVGSRGEVNTTREDLELGLVVLSLG